MDAIRAVITDDDPLVRGALMHLLARDPLIEVVGEAGDGAEAVRQVARLRPDVVLMDVQMPVMGGAEATAAIVAAAPGTAIVAVTTFDTRESVFAMLLAGAAAYVVKDASPDELIAAVRQASAGHSHLSPRVADLLVRYVRAQERAAGPDDELAVLTEREAAVVEHLARGMSNAEIAAALYVSEGTVKARLASIMAKWQVRDRVQVLVAAARAGLVDLA